MNSLAVWLHTIDPYAIMLWEGGPIRWYGLSYLLGFALAYLLVLRVTKVGRSTLKPQEAGDLIVALALGAVIGGRLGYVLFYRPDMWLKFHESFPWWGVLEMHRGGMASHGGMIGVIVGAWWFAFRRGHSWGHLLDLAAFGTPLGLFFGRIANFINGELYGRAVDSGSIAMHWAVRFPQEMFNWSSDQMLAIDRYLLQNGISSLRVRETYIPKIIHDIQQGDAKAIAYFEPLLTPRHPSQLYEALLEGLVLMAVLVVVWWKPRKPLVLGGWFCLSYGVVRIAGELFRMPDAHLLNSEFARFHITRGQWLSALLALAGLVMIVAASRRKVEPMGGWR